MHKRLGRRQAPAGATKSPGFFGKVPCLGDFVSRNVPPGFIGAWDAWLQRLVQASRARLGPDWQAAWLEMPVWHFTLGAGIAGPGSGVGVLIPSVDRVGRYFPFTILGITGPGGAALPDWTECAEMLALSALDDGFDPDRLAAELAALGPPCELACPAGETTWSCRDSARMAATLLRCPGLPDDDAAARLIAG